VNNITIKYINFDKTLPKKIDFTITLNTSVLCNVLLKLEIETIKKNNYTFFTNLSNNNGMLTVTEEELVKQINIETSFSIMDYCGIYNNFNGIILASIPNQKDIKNALDAYEQFSKYIEYPKKYMEKLLILKNTIESIDINTINIEYIICTDLK